MRSAVVAKSPEAMKSAKAGMYRLYMLLDVVDDVVDDVDDVDVKVDGLCTVVTGSMIGLTKAVVKR